ncbi:MAG: zinc-dependent metalloprotease [Microbacteriaceae bacterium]
MTDDESDDFRDMLRRFLENGEEFNVEQFAKAAGLPGDPAAIRAMLAQLQAALQHGGDGITEKLVRDTATQVANSAAVSVSADVLDVAQSAMQLASLWVDEATGISPLAATPTLMTRPEWSRASIPVWIQIAEPVALSVSRAAERLLTENMPDEVDSAREGAFDALGRLGGTLFSMQLGQIVGQLSSEVASGADLGIPLLDGTLDHELRAVLIPQNVVAFADGLDISLHDVMLYLAIREIAHARLFKHAKWLKHGLIASITEYANGISINSDALRDAMEDVDMSDPESLRRMVSDGALIPPKTDDQLVALARIETILAVVEGWVDVVTQSAAHRLPSRDAIAEMVRRQRAVGRPGEKALAGLVGIEVRPRRLREATAMWSLVNEAVGAEGRDALWDHADSVPTAADIDDPAALVARLTGGAGAPDEMDKALRELLDNDGAVDEN